MLQVQLRGDLRIQKEPNWNSRRQDQLGNYEELLDNFCELTNQNSKTG